MLSHALDPRSLRDLLVVLLLAGAARPTWGSEAFVTTTSFEISGSTSRVDLDPPYATTLDEYTIHSDAVVRLEGGWLFVLNRLYADNVLVLDPANGYGVVQQYSVTSVGANPQDLVVRDADKAYISLYESNSLWVGDPTTGAVTGTIDLSVFTADPDGLVEANQMERLGDHLFVTLQAVDRNGGWVPSGHSGLAVVDMATDQIVDADPDTGALDPIELQFQNPFWRTRYEPRLRRLVVLCSGSFLELDGALEIVNPFSLRSEGPLVTEAELGGDLLDYALVDDHLAYAMIQKPNYDTALVRFDPSTGTFLDTVYTSDGFALQNLELTQDGTLVMGDRSADAPGLRLFDAASGTALAGPIDVGLPPFDFVLVENAVTAVGPAPISAPRLTVRPNPVARGAMVRFAPSRARALAIYDSRGRLVRRLVGFRSEVGDGEDGVRFDGRDARGHRLAPGVYFVRELGGRGRTTKLTVLAD